MLLSPDRSLHRFSCNHDEDIPQWLGYFFPGLRNKVLEARWTSIPLIRPLGSSFLRHGSDPNGIEDQLTVHGRASNGNIYGKSGNENERTVADEGGRFPGSPGINERR